MEKGNVILGVDVSKNTLDFCCARRGIHIRTGNDSKGFALLGKWCRQEGIDLKATLFVLEYTGGYEYRFLQYCQSRGYRYCRIPGMEIKRSMGMVRGKSDRADSFRIGRYGEEKSARLDPEKPLNTNFIRLKQLLAFRKRLVRENAGYKTSVKERQTMYPGLRKDELVRISKEKIRANNRYIEKIEREIMEIIQGDQDMQVNYRLITSVKGIGRINACMTIAYTENFTSFTDARKYAVYVGVIPFERTSGISIRGRKRVSHLANKELKQELNQAAKSAIVHDDEIGTYAQRKLECKPYPLVLNNVKFKLILRMFSVVKRKKEYIKNYRSVA